MGKKRRASNASKSVREDAVRIMNADNMVKNISKRHWQVASESSPGSWHDVRVTNKRIICDCEYYTKRKGSPCKHTVAIEMLMLQQSEEMESGDTVTLSEVPVRCPKGKTHKFKKDGKRPRVMREDAQRYKCLHPGCGKRFSDGVGFTGRHYSSAVILISITLFALGISPKTISTAVLKPRFGVDVHHTTIQRWGDDFTSSMEKLTNGLRPRVSRLWGCDEKYQRISGMGHWIFTIQDITTRFILAWDVSRKKTNYDARGLFLSAQKRAGHIPLIFKTDGLKIFRTAFRDVFGKFKNIRPLHFWSSHMRNEYSDNNVHERFNGTLDELLHGSRGLQKTDAPLIRAALLYYNYVRPHESLCGRTPASKAGIHISGVDKWLILIQNAAMAA